jgi:hypothetical protein
MEQGRGLITGNAGRHAAAPGTAHITSCHTGSETDGRQQVQQRNGAASRAEQKQQVLWVEEDEQTIDQ